jgi:hypothetical protein
VESLDGDGDFGIDVNFSLGECIPCVVLELSDFNDAPVVPVVSSVIDLKLSVDLDNVDFLFNPESPFNSNSGDLLGRDGDDVINLSLGVDVDSDGLSPEPVLGFDFDLEYKNVHIVPDPDFHADSVSFGSGLQLKDDSSGFGVDSSFGFSNEGGGSDLPRDLELIYEFFESKIP